MAAKRSVLGVSIAICIAIRSAGARIQDPTKEVLTTGDETALIFENSQYAALGVSKEYMDKHKPEAGGYYVVYEDGYTSFSPAEAFEGGYTLVMDYDPDQSANPIGDN